MNKRRIVPLVALAFLLNSNVYADDLIEEIQIRVENSHLNLFCKDPSVLEEIDNALEQWIRKISGPTTQEELNSFRKMLVDTEISRWAIE